jgi:hypothetical protein
MKFSWTIIASIYSGRPDPRWEIDQDQVDRFMSLWQKAGLSQTEASTPSRSGYKGLRMIGDEKQFIIYDEIITCIEKTRRTSKNDENRVIERFLLNTAPEKILDTLKQFNIL